MVQARRLRFQRPPRPLLPQLAGSGRRSEVVVGPRRWPMRGRESRKMLGGAAARGSTKTAAAGRRQARPSDCSAHPHPLFVATRAEWKGCRTAVARCLQELGACPHTLNGLQESVRFLVLVVALLESLYLHETGTKHHRRLRRGGGGSASTPGRVMLFMMCYKCSFSRSGHCQPGEEQVTPGERALVHSSSTKQALLLHVDRNTSIGLRRPAKHARRGCGKRHRKPDAVQLPQRLRRRP